MKNQLCLLSFLIILFVSSASAQSETDNCPPLFTHNTTIIPEIKIGKIEVKDSTIYDYQPRFIEDLETIAKKITYPEKEKRVGVDGRVVLDIYIDSLGQVVKANILKGISGVGIEESTLDIIKKEKFIPAIKKNKKVPSQVVVDINFKLNISIDKPTMEIDEIKFEFYSVQITYIKTLIFMKDGTAFFSEDRDLKLSKKYVGKINPYLYTKLNDFIISQCFTEYENEYVNGAISYTGKTIITITSGDSEKSVTSNGQLEPVGLWAIRTMILQAKEQIKWEEVKE